MNEAHTSERFSSLEVLYRHCDQVAESHAEQWDESIAVAAQKVFQDSGVSNNAELLDKYADTTGMISMVEPVSVVTLADLTVLVGLNNKKRSLNVLDPQGFISAEVYDEDYPPENVICAERSAANLDEFEAEWPVATTWKSQFGGPLWNKKYEHIGIWAHKATEKGFGLALYKLHEQIFGKQMVEAAAGSRGAGIWKMYVTLGFRPVAVHNPHNGEIVPNSNASEFLLHSVNNSNLRSFGMLSFERQV